MYKVRVRPLADPQRPNVIQGVCTCGESGPETTNRANATLWGIGHSDGHKAVSRLK